MLWTGTEWVGSGVQRRVFPCPDMLTACAGRWSGGHGFGPGAASGDLKADPDHDPMVGRGSPVRFARSAAKKLMRSRASGPAG